MNLPKVAYKTLHVHGVSETSRKRQMNLFSKNLIAAELAALA